jgi:hypothetical protein
MLITDNKLPETEKQKAENSQNNIGVKIVGKIDISQFEKPKKEEIQIRKS